MLLHGWPYDIHSYADVAPLLAAQGYRVIVPYVRGCGTTSFLSRDARATASSRRSRSTRSLHGRTRDRQGDSSAASTGAAHGRHRRRALARALQGARLGERLSDRQPAAEQQPLPPAAEHQWWYQFYFATERGRAGYDEYRHEFGKLIWQLASPKWKFDDATFDAPPPSFDNPDYVAIAIHNYRWRLGLADGEAAVRRTREATRRSVPSSPCRRSRWKATRTAHRTPAPTYRENSRASTSTG